jgi:hypothetical protein
MVQVGCTSNYDRSALWKETKEFLRQEFPRVDYLRVVSENT